MSPGRAKRVRGSGRERCLQRSGLPINLWIFAARAFLMSTDLIRYDLLVQDALRSVVRKVLSDSARAGLPGDHHFNIAFKTHAPGVVVPPAIKSRFPEEMSIILQHEFWDLVVTHETFEVSLNFSRKPERLTVPFDAITGFTDPSVPFGFKLEPRVSEQPPEQKGPRAPGAGGG